MYIANVQTHITQHYNLHTQAYYKSYIKQNYTILHVYSNLSNNRRYTIITQSRLQILLFPTTAIYYLINQVVPPPSLRSYHS